jgi:hypothetical protein
MEDLIRQVLSILRGMWKYRWPAVVTAWVAAIVGVVVVFKIPDQYEASARIYVDTQSILKPLMAGLTVQPNVEQQVSMLSRTLISRPNVEKLIRMADMDLKSQFQGRAGSADRAADKDIQVKNTGATTCTRWPSGLRPGQGQARDPVAGVDLRRVEPGRQPQGHRLGQDLPERADQAVRGQARRSRSPGEGVPAAQHRHRSLGRQGCNHPGGRTEPQLEQAKLELREAENARDAAKQQLAAEKVQGASLATRACCRNRRSPWPRPRSTRASKRRSATWTPCCSVTPTSTLTSFPPRASC